MGKAARAIIIENNMLLVMHRNKSGSQYTTLVGGQSQGSETIEQTLAREIKEETGLDVIAARLVFIEKHRPPYNEQYIFLCTVAPHIDVAIHSASEEGFMNQIGINTHAPVWVDAEGFRRLAFRTPQLQAAIMHALQKGFPAEPISL